MQKNEVLSFFQLFKLYRDRHNKLNDPSEREKIELEVLSKLQNAKSAIFMYSNRYKSPVNFQQFPLTVDSLEGITFCIDKKDQSCPEIYMCWPFSSLINVRSNILDDLIKLDRDIATKKYFPISNFVYISILEYRD
ncbi:hypothetical protein J4471_05660 [Candidatus Woesearchaeota archaeon]|nr:hypothetical protein [Candidatus Woesearchaeota archaeon]